MACTVHTFPQNYGCHDRHDLHESWTSLMTQHALFTPSLRMSWQTSSAWELNQPHDMACPVHTFPQDVMTDKFCLRVEPASWHGMPCSHLPSGCHDRQVLHESWTSLMTWHALFTPSLRMSWQTSSAWELNQPHDMACHVHTFPQDVMTDKFCMRVEPASWHGMPCSHHPSGCHDRQVQEKKIGWGGGGGGGDCFEVDLENFDVKIDVSWQDFSGIYW